MIQGKNQRIIVILAMHRTGSSAVARGLGALGVDLGRNLIGAIPGDNERGFWEDADINSFNERLLEKSRSAWHALGRLNDEALQGAEYLDERREAGKLLSAKLTEGKTFGIKDPRTAILMPFWGRVFDDLSLDTRYLIVVRNPMESAASLHRRDGLPIAKGVMLWTKHLLDAVRHTETKPRIFVTYENLLSNCTLELKRIARAFDLPEPDENNREIQEYCGAFLSPQLRHHEYKLDDILQSGYAPAFVADLYRCLVKCADMPEGGDCIDANLFMKINRQHEEFAPVLELVDIYDKICVKAKLNSAQFEAENEKLLAQTEKLAEQIRQLAEDKERDAARAAETIQQLTIERDQRTSQASALKMELAKIREDAAAERERLITNINIHENARKELAREYRLSRAEIAAIRASTSWRITAPLRAAATILRNPVGGTRMVMRRLAQLAWRALPMSAAARGRLAARLFKTAPALFSWSGVYKAWRTDQNEALARSSPAENDVFNPPADSALDGHVTLTADRPPESLRARAIAFYLPQFHPIPENDEWWGEGFTEWTKVRPAKPLFKGHYQPHEPEELGYYDLLKDEHILARQVELARLHGLSGFCFYFYWFGGKRLLEGPLQKYLAAKEIEFPFCLCWANENWTRRWDGREEDVLIGQLHSPEDDTAFIEYVSRYLRDPRYMRVNGRPLLIVYRPALLPSPQETAERWRRRCRDNGVGEIYLAYTQSFESQAPEAYGFDAAIEFPPNNFGLRHEPGLAQGLPADSSVSIYDWRKAAARCVRYETPEYKLFRGVNPAWDNTPRRPHDGAILVNSSPSAYKAWLDAAAADAKNRFDDPDERLIFINAWNEWAEGAHLEPDKKYGYAWLEATRRAMDGAREKKLLIVIHDLHKHGSQYLTLNLMKTLRRRYGFEVALIAGVAGELAEAFASQGSLTVLNGQTAGRSIDNAIFEYAQRGFRHAIMNSAATGWVAPILSRHGFDMIGLVHEMPSVIEKMDLANNLRAFDAHARAVIFPAEVVRDTAGEAAGVENWANAKVLPQGVYKPQSTNDLDEKETARTRIRQSLGLPEDAFIILGVGYADHRKGVDIFVKWASAAATRWPDAHFVWLGGIDPDMQEICKRLIDGAGQRRKYVHFPGFVENTRDYYLAARLYALTSREDPFPSTALEALSAATPVVMIKNTGGIEDLAPHGCVRLADSAEPDAFFEAAADWIVNEAERRAAGLAGRDLMRSRFGFASYAGALTDILGNPAPNISVIVPNYNYARHLERRLASILDQTLSPREIIFLDDASTDDSIAAAERALYDSPINWRLICNESNSGDVFAQWRKGVAAAEGDLVWIAEADDWADPRFLETAERAFASDDIVLSFTQSNQIAEDGRVMARDYHDYVRDVSSIKWANAFVNDGLTEVREGLSVKNTIPNVSAVLFRRTPLFETLKAYESEIGTYRVAGDWCVYVNLLRKGAVAYSPESLNYHRRHEESVTISRFGLSELAEIAKMQAYVAENFSTPPEYAAKARAYLESLVRHFELERRYDAAKIDAAMAGVTA